MKDDGDVELADPKPQKTTSRARARASPGNGAATHFKEHRTRPRVNKKRITIGDQIKTFVVIRPSEKVLSNAYYYFMRVSWAQFWVTFAAAYSVSACVCTALFFIGDPASHFAPEDNTHFLSILAFNIQVMSTQGGYLTPVSAWAHTIISVESIVFVMLLAIITGLIFSKFSKPSVRVQFSNPCVITERDGCLALVFRIANLRKARIVEARASVSVYKNEYVRGQEKRTWTKLPLWRDWNPAFDSTWTIVHFIEPDSVLYGIGSAMLMQRQVTFLATVSGYEIASHSNVRAHKQYVPKDIRLSHVFEDIYKHSDDSKVVTLNLRRFHDTRYVASEFVTQQLAIGCAHYERENARELAECDAATLRRKANTGGGASNAEPDADDGLSPMAHERMLEEHAPTHRHGGVALLAEDALVNAPSFGRLESNGVTHHPDIFPLNSDGSSVESVSGGAMRSITVDPIQESGESRDESEEKTV